MSEKIWDDVPEAIRLEATRSERMALLATARRSDPKRYAEVNAEVMAPINAHRAEMAEKIAADARARAEADAQRRAKVAAKKNAELETMIDNRIAAKGVPSKD